MALCDRLEAAQAEAGEPAGRLAAASLHRLNQPCRTTDCRKPSATTPVSTSTTSRASPPAPNKSSNSAKPSSTSPSAVDSSPKTPTTNRRKRSTPGFHLRFIQLPIDWSAVCAPSPLIEPLDELPSGWGVAPIQSIGITQTGTTPSKSVSSFTGTTFLSSSPATLKEMTSTTRMKVCQPMASTPAV